MALFDYSEGLQKPFERIESAAVTLLEQIAGEAHSEGALQRAKECLSSSADFHYVALLPGVPCTVYPVTLATRMWLRACSLPFRRLVEFVHYLEALGLLKVRCMGGVAPAPRALLRPPHTHTPMDSAR